MLCRVCRYKVKMAGGVHEVPSEEFWQFLFAEAWGWGVGQNTDNTGSWGHIRHQAFTASEQMLSLGNNEATELDRGFLCYHWFRMACLLIRRLRSPYLF